KEDGQVEPEQILQEGAVDHRRLIDDDGLNVWQRFLPPEPQDAVCIERLVDQAVDGLGIDAFGPQHVGCLAAGGHGRHSGPGSRQVRYELRLAGASEAAHGEVLLWLGGVPVFNDFEGGFLVGTKLVRGWLSESANRQFCSCWMTGFMASMCRLEYRR